MSEEIKKIHQTPIDPMEFERESPYYQKPATEQAMVFDEPTKSFENKTFIVFIVEEGNDDMFDGHYKVCNGRTETYRYIQSLVESFGNDIDVHNSKIITETKQIEAETGNGKHYMTNFNSCLSIYAFCKGVEGFYEGSILNEFKIDDYFSPPEAKDIPDIDMNKLESDAMSFATHIDDPVVAQVAMEAFKERQMYIHNAMSFPAKVEKLLEPEEPYARSFPDLFEDDGNGVNV